MSGIGACCRVNTRSPPLRGSWASGAAKRLTRPGHVNEMLNPGLLAVRKADDTTAQSVGGEQRNMQLDAVSQSAVSCGKDATIMLEQRGCLDSAWMLNWFERRGPCPPPRRP